MNVGLLILGYLVFGFVSFMAVTSVKKRVFYFSLALGIALLLAHGFLILSRGIAAKRLPFTNTFETLILMAFLIIALYFLTLPRYRTPVLGGFAGIVASVILALTGFLPSEIEPLLPALKSNWLLFHVTTVLVGYASFAVAFGSAAIYLFWDFTSNRMINKPEEKQRIFEKLHYLDWLTYRLIAIGFPFLTLGIATGSIWANESWGRYWNWDPKETWSFVTWLIYVVLLHVRQAEVAASARIQAVLAFVGFVVVMFTYFGVNFWLSSLHAYTY